MEPENYRKFDSENLFVSSNGKDFEPVNICGENYLDPVIELENEKEIRMSGKMDLSEFNIGIDLSNQNDKAVIVCEITTNKLVKYPKSKKRRIRKKFGKKYGYIKKRIECSPIIDINVDNNLKGMMLYAYEGK